MAVPEVLELNQTNCRTYLLWSGGEALLVDPVRERVETYRKELRARKLSLKYIVETHMHADHIMFDRDTLGQFGVDLVMHEKSPSPLVKKHVRHGDEIKLGSASVRVAHTPGHTPDSMCLIIDGAVFTGDTLLIGGSGRTDFMGGDAGAQYDSIQEHIFSLPDETVIYPGHDYRGRSSSTVGKEKRENPRIAGRTRAQYIETMGQLNLPLPDKVQQALQVNQSGFHAGEVTFPPLSDVVDAENLPAAAVRDMLGEEDVLILDVREPEEFVGDLGHIEGALLVPLDALATRLPKLLGYAERRVVVVCRAGARSATACAILRPAGFQKVFNLADGMLGWVEAGFPVQR